VVCPRWACGGSSVMCGGYGLEDVRFLWARGVRVTTWCRMVIFVHDLGSLKTRWCTMVPDSASVGWLIYQFAYIWSILGGWRGGMSSKDEGKFWVWNFVWCRIEDNACFEMVLYFDFWFFFFDFFFILILILKRLLMVQTSSTYFGPLDASDSEDLKI
jgi:hypothetical protein